MTKLIKLDSLLQEVFNSSRSGPSEPSREGYICTNYRVKPVYLSNSGVEAVYFWRGLLSWFFVAVSIIKYFEIFQIFILALNIVCI